MTEIAKLKEHLHKLCTEVENLSIENAVYFDAVIESRTINIPDLNDQVAQALINPERRKTAQVQYAEMRQALSDTALDAVFADLLANLPKHQKPN
jgi:hypothetical protein